MKKIDLNLTPPNILLIHWKNMFTDPDLLDLDRLDKLWENELVLHLVKHNHPPNCAPPPPAGLEPNERIIDNV